MTGIYQHCDEKHLHRYLTEYQFRYNNRVKLGVSDIDRTIAAVHGIEGKRLMYRQLTKPVFRLAAGRFLRWRKKRRKK
jgi:hypothetical protein